MKNILVVDDDYGVRQALQTYFDDEFNVSVASSGEMALTMIQDNEFDLVITDFQMFQMNGIALIVEVRKTKPNQKFLLCSGSFGLQKILNANDITDVPIFTKGACTLATLLKMAKEMTE